jgi:hypothetical protein
LQDALARRIYDPVMRIRVWNDGFHYEHQNFERRLKSAGRSTELTYPREVPRFGERFRQQDFQRPRYGISEQMTGT